MKTVIETQAELIAQGLRGDALQAGVEASQAAGDTEQLHYWRENIILGLSIGGLSGRALLREMYRQDTDMNAGRETGVEN